MSSLGDFTHSDRLNSNEAVPKFLFSPELIGRMQIARCCVNECAVQSEEVRTHNLIVRILSHWFSTAYGISTDTIVQFFDSIMRIGRKSIEWLFTEASPLTLKNFLWAFTCHRLALVFEELWLAITWKNPTHLFSRRVERQQFSANAFVSACVERFESINGSLKNKKFVISSRKVCSE